MGYGVNRAKIYVNELAEGPYLGPGAPYPNCAKIVKPLDRNAEAIWARRITVMNNRPKRVAIWKISTKYTHRHESGAQDRTVRRMARTPPPTPKRVFRERDWK